MSNFKSIHHSSLIISNLEASLRFYCDILGLHVDPARPELDYEGAWLWVGDQQIHLLVLPNPDPTEGRPVHGGRDRHIALSVVDLAKLQGKLDNEEIDYTQSKSGRRAIFCRDPDAHALEFIESL